MDKAVAFSETYDQAAATDFTTGERMKGKGGVFRRSLETSMRAEIFIRTLAKISTPSSFSSQMTLFSLMLRPFTSVCGQITPS